MTTSVGDTKTKMTSSPVKKSLVDILPWHVDQEEIYDGNIKCNKSVMDSYTKIIEVSLLKMFESIPDEIMEQISVNLDSKSLTNPKKMWTIHASNTSHTKSLKSPEQVWGLTATIYLSHLDGFMGSMTEYWNARNILMMHSSTEPVKTFGDCRDIPTLALTTERYNGYKDNGMIYSPDVIFATYINLYILPKWMVDNFDYVKKMYNEEMGL